MRLEPVSLSVDYSGWDMLNVKMMQTGSSIVRWRLREPGRAQGTWDCVKGDMERFGLSCEDAQDIDRWRLKIKGETS